GSLNSAASSRASGEAYRAIAFCCWRTASSTAGGCRRSATGWPARDSFIDRWSISRVVMRMNCASICGYFFLNSVFHARIRFGSSAAYITTLPSFSAWASRKRWRSSPESLASSSSRSCTPAPAAWPRATVGQATVAASRIRSAPMAHWWRGERLDISSSFPESRPVSRSTLRSGHGTARRDVGRRLRGVTGGHAASGRDRQPHDLLHALLDAQAVGCPRQRARAQANPLDLGGPL